MESLASPFPETAPLDLSHVERACDNAARAAGRAETPAAAIEGALDVLHDELGAAGVCAFVLEHGRLWSVGARGYAIMPDGLPLDEGVVGRVVRTSAVQLVEDVGADPDYVEILPGVVSELGVPLLTATGLVGVINIETTARLPAGSDVAVRPLVQALAEPMEEMRSTRTVDLSSLARLFVYMSSLRDPLAISEVAVRSLARVLPIETSQLLILDEVAQLVPSTEWSARGGPETLSPQALQALSARIDQSAVFELLDTTAVNVPELVGTRVRSVVLIPLRANGGEIGLLVGTSRFGKEFDRGQAELAALLSAHTAASLDAALALGRERRSAHTDPLTGLLNRRGLEDRLDRELEAAQAERLPLSLAVLDCDDFKDVNDRAGHEFGDALLREVGLVLRRACPDSGSAARLGGDEFVVMLPETDAEAAYEEVARIRRELDHGLADAGFPLRMSAGISTYPYDGGGASQLLRAADQALYGAKAGGKNRAIGFREIVGGAGAPLPASDGPTLRRAGHAPDGSALADTMEASAAIWAEESVDAVLERLSKATAFVVGATATLISRVEGARLADTARHSLRDVDLGEDTSYTIADFPVTQEVLENACLKSISFLDEDLDSAEAFVLRELEMNAAILVPLVVNGRSWGLVEIYDMRLRRFSGEDEAVAWFLVCQAARKIESLGEAPAPKRRLPVFHLPFG
jgi:diguanylate cyclase (GGDEF)-like protein